MLLTRQQAADQLKVSYDVVTRLVERGHLPAINVGRGRKRAWRIDAKDVRAYRARLRVGERREPLVPVERGEQLTPRDAARYMGLTYGAIRYRIASGLLEAQRAADGRWIITREACRRSLRRKAAPNGRLSPALTEEAEAVVEARPAPAPDAAQRAAGGLVGLALRERLAEHHTQIEGTIRAEIEGLRTQVEGLRAQIDTITALIRPLFE